MSADDAALPPITEDQWREDVTQLIRERDDARALIAALVLMYGEFVATGHRRAGLGPDTLERATGAHLSVHMDPDSGAVLIHVRTGGTLPPGFGMGP